MKHNYLTLCVAALLFCACAKQNDTAAEHSLESLPTASSAVSTASFSDTIVYTVSILPQNPQDPTEAENLSRLNRKALVDSLFACIYTGKASVTDFSSGKPLEIDEIKEREITDPRFAREKVAALQFTEAWSFDKDNCSFQKKVVSIHIAYEVRDTNDDSFVCYRAGIIIHTKQ